ncbi:MAG: hypothetical protein JW804_05720 [Sedimentisphaerales bacterium]|nr:hypothetical protein [Sedimentisphaerales bacterium]
MKALFKIITRTPSLIIASVFAAAVLLVSVGIYRGGVSLHDLLTENKQLKQSLTNLTDEGKIGYAKVLSQDVDDKGNVVSTTLKFIETARDSELETILEKQYTVAGDVVHFDAMIVKFGNQMVMDGKARSLYLWRRIYGEEMPPVKGFPIEEPGTEPQRYKALLAALRLKERELFWSSIWELANDPYLLVQYDIEAIYGNVTYAKLKKGLVYIFRITPTGQIYPEVIPDI